MKQNKDPCRDCGLCCQELILEIDHLDVVREPKLLETGAATLFTGVQFDNVWAQQYSLNNGPGHSCMMLNADKRCSIYPTRPSCCVEYEAGGEHCNALREEHGLPPVEVNHA